MNWTPPDIPSPCATSRNLAQERQTQLTKPPGSLGRLETLATDLAALQGTPLPRADQFWITVFAADHGMATEGVSAFPQSVTAAMARNFLRGGAAINVLASQLGAHLEVVDCGMREPLLASEIISARAGNGSSNFTHGPAMTGLQLETALLAGSDSIARAVARQTQIFIGGEMGIGNTTAASALACALMGIEPERMTGLGTGIDQAGFTRKIEVIHRALALHSLHGQTPLDCLRCLGGFEIAALTSAYLHAAANRLPILVDGFIATVGALTAVRLAPASRAYMIFSHSSREPGHRLLLNELKANPLLDLSLRLGEGSGAAIAASLLRTACALHHDMATFSEAGVPTA